MPPQLVIIFCIGSFLLNLAGFYKLDMLRLVDTIPSS